MTTRRRRLDTELVRRGMAQTRTGARRLIDDRRVRVGGSVAEKPARLVDPGEAVDLAGDPPRYVSRGGEKLEAALATFGINPAGLRAIDVGASTGGFTDCLLQHGAVSVTAIDVGRNQLHERLRSDGRVLSLERTDVRGLDPAAAGGAAPLLTADLSFISLRAVIADLLALAAADMVLLVKPQFEAGKAAADRGRGVIRDPQDWRAAVVGVCDALSAAGACILGVMVSPITGAQGNVEFLVHAHAGRHADDADGLSECARAVAAAVDAALVMTSTEVAGGVS